MDNQDFENKKKGSKRPYVVAILLALALVITIVSTSYAYFVGTVNNGTVNNTVVTTTSLEIEFTDGPQVSLENAIPGSYIEKTFKVENKGSGDTTYDIYMSDLINDFGDKTDLVYTLTSNDGGANVSTQTQVPSTSSKIVSSQLLRAGEEHNYTLRLDFLETNDNQDDNKGKTFSTIIRINEVHDAPAYRIVSGDLETVGSEVCIGTECFYVIGQEDSTHVKLLAKYNLGVGNGFETPTNIQEETATGFIESSTSPYPGTVKFSNSDYWEFYEAGMGIGCLVSTYGGGCGNYYANVYDSNSYVYQYVNDYVTYLNQQGVSVTGRLIYRTEYIDLENNYSNPTWLRTSSYWTGYSYCYGYVTVVKTTIGLSSDFYNNSSYYGVRPVIILES